MLCKILSLEVFNNGEESITGNVCVCVCVCVCERERERERKREDKREFLKMSKIGNTSSKSNT